MTISNMQSALEQLRALQAEATGGETRTQKLSRPDEAGGFASELQDSIARINQLQQVSGASRKAFEAGSPDVSLNEVMVNSQKASVAFEMGVQLRNRLVSAYKEIMNMQV